LFTVKISDLILDSRVGALDRALGFLFGLGRGFLIMVVAFIFFAWLVPEKGRPEWVKGAKSAVVLQGAGLWLQSVLPEDLERLISNALGSRKRDDGPAGTPAPASPVR
jgi:membrane protein required for colicin V production